jgi:hypothetical protein
MTQRVQSLLASPEGTAKLRRDLTAVGGLLSTHLRTVVSRYAGALPALCVSSRRRCARRGQAVPAQGLHQITRIDVRVLRSRALTSDTRVQDV